MLILPQLCYPLSKTCLIDWEAWAAIGTMLAVFVALFESSRSAALVHQVRREDLQRADERAKAITTRLALTFHKELFRAGLELATIIKATRNLSPSTAYQYKQLFAKPLGSRPLEMMSRFVADLDGFRTEDAVAILNAVSVWNNIPMFSEGIPADLPEQYLLDNKTVIESHIKQTMDVFQELQTVLEPYFKDVPGIQHVTLEEMRMRSKRAQPE